MDAYYSKEKQAQYGVVGIEVECLAPTDPLLAASRFLSLLLRHKPDAAGITLDEHGWADVPQLLRGMAHRHPLTMAQLEEIVRTDSKQRYAFNADKTKIRANQGHSVRVDVELEQLEPPAVLYHGTGEKNVDSILKEGLLPQTRLYVHLSKDTDTAQTVGARHGKPAVFVVESGRMYADGFVFYRSQNGVWLTAHVPPAYLKRDDK
ncbi:MAG: RNA 2'-phosphotransferase [Ruminococcaceae bacterium]|nr:RNA 2'-phosphotransferase [Oscillospiraceae bacterium]